MSETKILRILVEVESSTGETWRVAFSAPEMPAHSGWRPTRPMTKLGLGRHSFPGLAPDGEEADLPDPGEAHYDLCIDRSPSALGELYDRITGRAPVSKNKDVSVFGRYLFDTLIGGRIWDQIVKLAEREAAEFVELALAWRSDEHDLNRINWEMMHGPRDFLAAKHPTCPREVTITRVVKDAAWDARTVGPVPRSLFVIGTSLTDMRIRPGAEYLGLLRQIERSGRAIHSRILRGQNGQGAAPSDVKRAMVEFKPEIVHFICHGEFGERGRASLELASEPDEQEKSKLYDAEQIFQFLSEGKSLPAIVVLSACHTGHAHGVNLLTGEADGQGNETEVAIPGSHETAPMAAGLVSRGIPVVVAMAGRVADSACRHFTRRFGEAVVRGELLVKATAEGRRAAFAYDDQSPEESVDWAFPAVFASTKVPSDYTPAPPAQAGEIAPVEKWVASYHKKRGNEPALCGRHEFFDAYYDLFSHDEHKPSVLGAYVDPSSRVDTGAHASSEHEEDRGFGKRRLLRELTVQAVRDGHIPVVVSSDSENWEPPKTVADLLAELFKALNETRRIYGLDKTTWQISALIDLSEGRDAKLDDNVQEIYEEERKTVNARVIREALAADMTHLIETAHAKHAFLREAPGSAILFLGEVHKYDVGFLEKWFSREVLGKGGLRRDEALSGENEPWDPSGTILPVVMTFSTAGAANIILTTLKERGESLDWIRFKPLLPFPAKDDVDLMAYEHVLLNPFDTRGELRRDVSNRAFALNRKAEPDDWSSWCNWIREDYGGLPKYFVTRSCYKFVEIACKSQFLVEADDERKLKEYMEK